MITNILLCMLVICAIVISITLASINYKHKQRNRLLSRLIEIELPTLTAAISEIEPMSDRELPPFFLWPGRNNNGLGMRH